MVLRVTPTLTRFTTNVLYTLVDNIQLRSIPSMWHPAGVANTFQKMQLVSYNENCVQLIAGIR